MLPSLLPSTSIPRALNCASSSASCFFWQQGQSVRKGTKGEQWKDKGTSWRCINAKPTGDEDYDSKDWPRPMDVD